MTYFPVILMHKLSLKRRRSSVASIHKMRSDSIMEPLTCQLHLVTALQGSDVDALTRQSIATTLEELDPAQRKLMLDFLIETAIPAAMENNACKAFECSTDKLNGILDDENVNRLTELWGRTLTQVLPTMQTMLYSIKSTEPGFDIRREILKSFRDQVLIPLLQESHVTSTALSPMTCLVSFVTADDSQEFQLFNQITDRIIGTNRSFDRPEDPDTEKLKSLSKSRLSVQNSMNGARRQMYIKRRANTLTISQNIEHLN